MNSDSTNTDFSKKCEILDELWMNYRGEQAFETYMEYNDLALPLAFAINEDIIESSKVAEGYINEAWMFLCEMLNVDPNLYYESLDHLMSAAQG